MPGRVGAAGESHVELLCLLGEDRQRGGLAVGRGVVIAPSRHTSSAFWFFRIAFCMPVTRPRLQPSAGPEGVRREIGRRRAGGRGEHRIGRGDLAADEAVGDVAQRLQRDRAAAAAAGGSHAEARGLHVLRRTEAVRLAAEGGAELFLRLPDLEVAPAGVARDARELGGEARAPLLQVRLRVALHLA